MSYVIETGPGRSFAFELDTARPMLVKETRTSDGNTRFCSEGDTGPIHIESRVEMTKLGELGKYNVTLTNRRGFIPSELNITSLQTTTKNHPVVAFRPTELPTPIRPLAIAPLTENCRLNVGIGKEVGIKLKPLEGRLMNKGQTIVFPEGSYIRLGQSIVRVDILPGSIIKLCLVIGEYYPYNALVQRMAFPIQSIEYPWRLIRGKLVTAPYDCWGLLDLLTQLGLSTQIGLATPVEQKQIDSIWRQK